MKSKYMSRKFIIALVGLIDSLAATYYGNTIIAIAGIALAGCFVIGESIIDKEGAIKREQRITINEYKDAPIKEDKTNA